MMRREGGVATITGPEGSRSASTFTCVHCGSLVHVRTNQRAEDVGGICRHCLDVKNPLSGLICPACVKVGTCYPFEKRIEELERRYAAVAEYFK